MIYNIMYALTDRNPHTNEYTYINAYTHTHTHTYIYITWVGTRTPTKGVALRATH
jgi:hypothetical protein